MNINQVTYPIKIQFKDSLENKLSPFRVLEHKVMDTSLKVLVCYQRHSEGNPEMEAIWDSSKCRLFLICRKWEAHTIDLSTGFCSSAKEQSAWIDIDLTPLCLNKTLYVYTHQLGSRRGLEAGPDSILVKEAYDELIAEIHF